MKIISMKQLRQKFDPIRKSLERGDEYLLMYRSKPLAVIRPYAPATDAQHLGVKAPAQQKLPTIRPLDNLPSPKVISFGSKITADTPVPSKPLERLGMKKAFV